MSDPQFVLRVALDVPLRRLFDYLPQAGIGRDEYKPGRRIKVPFGRRTLVGVIVETTTSASVPLRSLKAAEELLDGWPVLSSSLVQLCNWSAEYYQHPPGEVFLQALPTLLRQAQAPEQPTVYLWRLKEGIHSQQVKLRGIRQRSLIEELERANGGIAEGELRQRGYPAETIQKLHTMGLIEAIRQDYPQSESLQTTEQPYQLSPAQSACLATLCSGDTNYRGVLLYGVTGSGKTEIYLQWIEHLLQRKTQVLILVPEISLTPQTITRFQRRFGNVVAAYHSGLTDLERWRTWDNARQGRTRIVIGTRSAVFLAFQSLGAIIVDEEHDSSYKQQEGFRYSARDLAMVRGKLENVPVLLGSATPSLESLRNVELGKYKMLRLDERAGAAQPAAVELLDIKSRPLQAGLSRPLVDRIQQHLDQGEQILLFINRRGYAPVLMCQDCGWMAECRHCDVRMTLHRKPPHLRCHHCDSATAIPVTCPKCDSRALQPIGTGTERTEDELQRLFRETTVHRIDSDTTRSKKRFAEMLEGIQTGEPCILVGTQILAKGHHFPKVTLAAIINADSGLFSSDFRATERMVQTLVQVAGRAGREGTNGRVIIQTHHADHALLQSIASDDYLTIATRLLAERQAADLPPYHALALLQAEAKTLNQALEWLSHQRAAAENQASLLGSAAIRFIGPLPALIERRADRYRAQLQLSTPSRGSLKAVLQQLLAHIESEKHPAGIRWSIDVDPVDLL